jgi:SAM-dependent methyltransferase
MLAREKSDGREFCEHGYDDWFADIYDEWYAELLDPAKGSYRPVKLLLNGFPELAGRKASEITVLDAACGTGGSYIALVKDGYSAWAADGSKRMLAHAASNCRKENDPETRLVDEPVTWTDQEAYKRLFLDRGINFDVIVLSSNSFCHLPAVPGYMDTALKNFHDLLKPGGRLLIDTKKYIRTGENNGVPMFSELQFVAPEWIVRTARTDGPHDISRLGSVHFHTRLLYDVDPHFEICRATVVVSIYGGIAAPQTRYLSYYPLPATKLESELKSVGFTTSRWEARTPPLDWSYDFVVAQKMG